MEEQGEELNRKLMDLFAEYLEKEELLIQITGSSGTKGCTISEEHVIDAIGTLESPNVTSVAAHLKMTRGAISKIAARLRKAGLIDAYQLPDNKKSVFFELTDSGREVFEAHRARHTRWEERDMAFFARYTVEERAFLASFMGELNAYLGEQAEALSS